MLRPSSKQAQIFRCVTVMVSHACITRHLEGNPKCCAFCCKPTPRISTRRTEFVLPSGFPGSTIVTVFAAVCLRYSSSSQRGATALMLACYLAHAIELGEGRKMIIKLLLEAGADIFLQNKDGETAKDVLGQDRPEILRIFQEHEEYLSKIGSRTKPALRAVAPAAASQDPAEAVPLGLMLPSDLPIADDHGQSTVGDTSQGIEGQPADDSTHAVAVAGDAAEFVEAAEPMEDSEQESTEQTQDTIRWPRAPALQLDLSDLGTELGIEATSPLHTDAAANSPTATSQEQSNDAAEFVGKRRRRDVE
eukprot:m.468082 g.468082  ORF g.468082 m.468082 type:complete len:306 (+) comp57070_c0_seq11:1425-2342(+)